MTFGDLVRRCRATACALAVSSTVLSQELSDSISHHLPAITTLGTRLASASILTPLALSVVRPSDLPGLRSAGIDEALNVIPGVLAFSRMGSHDVRLTMRGYGARGAGERSNSGTSRGIKVLLDGFPETEPDGRTAFDLIDLSAVEVVEAVRSNVSSLWGNASGGAVNFRTYRLFENPFLKVSSINGDLGFRKESLLAGAFVGEKRLLFSASNSNSPGWRDHSGSSLTRFSLSLHSPSGDDTRLDVFATGANNLFRIPGPLTSDAYESDPTRADSSFLVRDERRWNKVGRIGVRFEHDLASDQTLAATLFVNPKVLQRSERNTFRDFNRYHLGGSVQFEGTVFRGEYIEGALLVGLDEAYQDGTILFYSLTPSGGRGPDLRENKSEAANTFGVFMQSRLRLGETWQIIAGGRYDDISYRTQSFLRSTLSDAKSFHQVTPTFGISYALSTTHSFYANVGGGIEVPAGNETDPEPNDTVHALNPLLEPMRSVSIEAGTKHYFDVGGKTFGGSVSYEVSVYLLEVRNDLIPYRNGRFFFTAGRSRRGGIETGMRIDTRMGLVLEGSFTFTRNTYLDYRIDSVHYDPARAGIFADLSGNRVAGIPTSYGYASARYLFRMDVPVVASVGVQYVGGYFADDANRLWVPSWTVAHVMLGCEEIELTENGFSLTARIGVQNVFDRSYIGSAWINPDVDASGDHKYIEPALPRNWTFSFSVAKSF